MDFALTEQQEMIRKEVATLAGSFSLDYWLEKDRKHEYPWDFVKAFARAGWLGAIIPEAYGGSGLGVTEAAILLHEICASGAGTSGASPIHFYVFPPMPVIKHGSERLKEKYLPKIATGEIVMSFGVTEPNVGSDTSRIQTPAVRQGDRRGVNGRKVRNPERVLTGIEAVGIGRAALGRAVEYAKQRVVFDRPIGQNQAIAHPLAMAWAKLEAAEAMCLKAAWLFDHGQPCGAESNVAKLLGAEAGFEACDVALQTHGGYGYAKEFYVERLWREVRLYKIAPVSQQMVLNHLAEHVLGLPKSY